MTFKRVLKYATLVFAAAAAGGTIFQAFVARETEHNGQRAYLGPVYGSFDVYCQTCRPSLHPNSSDTQRLLPRDGMLFKIKNFGTSPALDVEACGKLVAIPKGEAQRPGETDDEFEYRSQQPTIDGANKFFYACGGRNREGATKHDRDVTPTIWPADVRTEIREATGDFPQNAQSVAVGNSVGFILGLITYKDIFGIRHHTYFCRRLALPLPPPPMPVGPGLFIAPGPSQVWMILGCRLLSGWQDD